jgi:anti-sigma regulatory factor (Ser/Thr protein kinase)
VRREVTLPATAAAPRLARAALGEATPPPDLGERLDDASLALTEVVTNAVVHGSLDAERDTITLVIDVDDSRLRAAVEQPTVVAIHPDGLDRRIDAMPSSGFGLRIVASTADDWGIEPGPPGHVWLEFRRTPAS